MAGDKRGTYKMPVMWRIMALYLNIKCWFKPDTRSMGERTQDLRNFLSDYPADRSVHNIHAVLDECDEIEKAIREETMSDTQAKATPSKAAMELAVDIEKYLGLQDCTKPIQEMIAKKG